MTVLRPVVLSGGSGTRLWPLSTHDIPKQFAPLFEGRSLFELTLSRLDGIADVGPPLVVAGVDHVELVERSLIDSGIGNGLVIVEPKGRNTAPAALAAALLAGPEDVLVILPSDHLVSDVAGFESAVAVAASHATSGPIVTFGIHPSRPETGYGYIEMGPSAGEGAFEVARFKEKPGLAEAESMVSDGRHVWNSGMFVATAKSLLAEAEEHCETVLRGVEAALPAPAEGTIELGASFAGVDAVSIDYAIMEKTERALVVPIDLGWDDVGSYASLLNAVERDENGNHVSGAVTLRDVEGSFISARSRKVVVAGLSDVVVVETEDAVLVVPLDRSQEVGEFSRQADHD
ncbi:MAG TPA: sugar phosphate nucleotidyltransferase [Acidimicrobiia bacterium]|nr:sugar phosphate nucleotidyltransferase [Acidimicrobiia bacterium]